MSLCKSLLTWILTSEHDCRNTKVNNKSVSHLSHDVGTWVVDREVSTAYCWSTGLPLCFVIVDVHASQISIPLSLLMLLGWSIMWIASLTLRMYLVSNGYLSSFVQKLTRSHLVRPKDTIQDSVVYRIPCECWKVYLSETGRSIQERIKDNDRDLRLARTQTSAVSEHHSPPLALERGKFIDQDSH